MKGRIGGGTEGICRWSKVAKTRGNEKSKIESYSCPLRHCRVGPSPRRFHRRPDTVCVSAECFHLSLTCRLSPCPASPQSLRSAVHRKRHACWQRPREVGFPLKHNYSILTGGTEIPPNGIKYSGKKNGLRTVQRKKKN